MDQFYEIRIHNIMYMVFVNTVLNNQQTRQ